MSGSEKTITISRKKAIIVGILLAIIGGVMYVNTRESQAEDRARGTPITNLEIGHIYHVVGIVEQLNSDGSLEFKLADDTPVPKYYKLPANETSWIYLGVNITQLDDGSIRKVPPNGPLENHDS